MLLLPLPLLLLLVRLKLACLIPWRAPPCVCRGRRIYITYTYTHIHIYTHTHTHIHTYIHTHTYVYIYIYIYILCVYICALVHMTGYLYIYVYTSIFWCDLQTMSSPSLDRPKSPVPAFSLAYPLPGTSMVRWQLLHVAAYFGHADAVKVPCLQPNHSPRWILPRTGLGWAGREDWGVCGFLWMLVAFHFGISDHKTLAHTVHPIWSVLVLYSKW